jgi:pyridoxal phosphate enzyme (YggS family)
MGSIAERLAKLRSEISTSAEIVAVSKTKPVEVIQEAYDAGQRIFGENRVQELLDKHPQLPDDIKWHMIGHLQTNKVKYIVPFVSLIHSIDSEKLLNTVQKEAAKINKPVGVLLQVHIAEEEHKYGFSFDETRTLLCENYREKYSHVEICGLMGMATFTYDEDQIRQEFDRLGKFYQDLNTTHHFEYLSMGMSGDYQLAIEAGSNLVRIGSLIFGAR